MRRSPSRPSSRAGLATPRTSTQVAGGRLTKGEMPCPDCGAPMDLPFTALFSGRPIWCTACGAKLQVDLGASAPALNQLQEGLAQLESMRAQAGR